MPGQGTKKIGGYHPPAMDKIELRTKVRRTGRRTRQAPQVNNKERISTAGKQPAKKNANKHLISQSSNDYFNKND